MALNNIVESAQVYQSYLIVKFKISPLVTSLDNGDFRILHSTNGAPGLPVSGTSTGFRPIDLATDYESISKRLQIYFNQSMVQGDYFLEISNFYDANGTAYLDEDDPLYFPFSYYFTSPLPEATDQEAGRPPIEVQDFSIKSFSVVETGTGTTNPDFTVTKIDPLDREYFIDNDHRRGCVTVTFSSRPSLAYINADYIRVQRKKLGAIGRWETITAKFSLDSTDPKLYIYFPDLLTGEYDTSGLAYFEDGYKYRVRLFGDIAGVS